MYCQTCGTEVSDKLNYCKNCGIKLIKADEDKDKGPRSVLGLLVASVSFITIFGLGILIGLVAVLLGNSVQSEFVMIIAVVYLLALSFICGMILRLIARLVNAQFEQKEEKREISETYRAPQLGKPKMAALNEPLQPVASVTEHTTRTLDQVLVERK